MTDVISLSKKAFTWSVVSMTILWSVGFAAFVPMVAHAAECPALQVGDLLKAETGSAVYVLNADLEAAYFPHSSVYSTWFEDYSGIVTLSAECFDDYPAAQGVNYMPGTNLVTRVETPTVYAVLPGNMAAPIGSEEVARALYGDNWTSKVRDIHTFHWVNYTVVDAISEAVPHDGMLVTTAGTDNVYWVEDGEYIMVDGDLGPWNAFVNEVSQAVFDTLPMGTGSVTPASLVEDPTQGAVSGNSGNPGTETPVEAGELRFSVAASSAASATVPGNAQGVPFFSFVVTGEGELGSITFNRSGVGDKDSFERIYLYNGNTRVGNGRSLNNDDEVTFSVNMEIDGTETFTVRADMASVTGNAGDEHYFEIASEGDIDTDADVEGSFPLRGNTLEVGSTNIGGVEVTATGASTGDAEIGEDEVLIGQFQLAASSDDVWVSSIVLENKGSADTDALENIELREGGNVVAEGEIMGDYIMFEFDELYEIEESDDETFKVYADIGIADIDDTIQLILDEETDLEAYSEGFEGFLADVTNTDLDTDNALVVTLDGGAINVDFTGSNEDVRADQQNVGFGVFEIVATSEDVDVDTLTFTLVRANSAPCLEDLRLVDLNGNGSYTLDEAGAACTTGTTDVDYEVENILLEQGVAYEFEIRADVADAAVEDDQYQFTWAAADFDGEGADSGNNVDADDFSSASLSGPIMTVSPASLEVRSKSLTSITVVEGAEHVLFFRGELEAGSTSDVTINSVTVQDENGNAWDNRISGLSFYAGNTTNLVDTMDALDVDNSVSGEEAIFNGLDLVIPAGAQGTTYFEIYGNVVDGATAGVVDVKITDVDADDEDGDEVVPQTATGTAFTAGDFAGVVTGRNVTIASAGTLTAEVDNNVTGLRNDRYGLAGDNVLLGRVKLQADDEDVTLEDLVLNFDTNGSDAEFYATFDTVSLYTDMAMTNRIATEGAVPGDVTFDDVNFDVTADETVYLYVGVDVNSIGKTGDGTAIAGTDIWFTGEDTGTTAEGVSSGDTIDPTVAETPDTNNVEIVGTRIYIDTEFANGTLSGGNQNIFSFEISADANGNKTTTTGELLTAELQRLELTLSTDVGTSTSTENITDIQLCRVDTSTCLDLETVTTLSGSVQSTALQSVGTVGFIDLSTSTFTDENADEVESGETVQFVVKATVSNVTDKFVQVSVSDLSGNGLTWAYDTDDDATVNVTHSDLRADAPRDSNYPTLRGGSLSN